MVEFRDGSIVSDEYITHDIPDGFYYSQEEFAEIMDVSPGIVRVWVSRGIVPAVHYYGRTYIPYGAPFKYVRPWMRRRKELDMKRGICNTAQH